MKMMRLHAFVTLLLASVEAFTFPSEIIPNQKQRADGDRVFTSSTQVFASLQNDADTEQVLVEEKGVTTLNFKANYAFESDPIPLRSAEDLQSFFEKDDIRRILLGGSGESKVEEFPMEKGIDLKKKWVKQSIAVGGEMPCPEDGDVVCRVESPGINFPGLQVVSDSIIGTKLVRKTDASSCPEYQMVFIEDKRSAKGPRPLVWIFNKLTGAGKEDKSEEKEQSVTSLSKVSANVVSDDSFVFTIDASLNVAVKFPSFLMKILPVSKEKAEQQGSESIMKMLVQNTEPVMRCMLESY